MALVTLEQNRENWEGADLLQNEPWLPRAQKASMFVMPGEKVLDLGCGLQLPRQFLEQKCTYLPCDMVQRTPDTIVCDLNKNEFPEGQFDSVLMLGVLEYIPDIEFVLKKLQTCSKKVIFTYCLPKTLTPRTLELRSSYRWLTHWTAPQLDTYIKQHNFKLAHMEVISQTSVFRQVLGVLVNKSPLPELQEFPYAVSPPSDLEDHSAA